MHKEKSRISEEETKMGEDESCQRRDVTFSHPHMNDLLVLADVAGIKAPGNVMKILIELLGIGVAPVELHQLLRSAVRSHIQRTSAKHTSRRSRSRPVDEMSQQSSESNKT